MRWLQWLRDRVGQKAGPPEPSPKPSTPEERDEAEKMLSILIDELDILRQSYGKEQSRV